MAVDLTKYIASKIDKFKNDIHKNPLIASPMGFGQYVTSNLAKDAINGISNFHIGNNPTVGQSVQSTLADPNKWNVAHALSSGYLSVGNKKLDNYITRPVGQAAGNAMSGITFGLLNSQLPKANTLPEKIGAGVGNVAGLIGGMETGSRILNPIGDLGSLGTKNLLGGRLGTGIISKVAPAIGSELATTGALSAANAAVGNKVDPLGQFAMGIGLRGTGAGVGKLYNKARGPLNNVLTAAHPDDARALDEAVNIIRNKKSILGDRIQATKDIDNLLYGYIQQRTPAKEFENLLNSHVDQKIKVLQKFLRNADDYNVPYMGQQLVGDNISSEGSIIKGKLNSFSTPTQTEIKNRAEISAGNPDLYTQRKAKLEQAGIPTNEGNPEPLPWENTPNPSVKPSGKKLPKPGLEMTSDTAGELAAKAQYRSENNDKDFQNIFARWIGKKDAAETEGTIVGSKFKDIPTSEGPAVIKAMEDPSVPTSSKGQEQIQNLHKEFDRMYNDAINNGIDIGYRENYITHYWDKPQDQVQQLYQVFKKREGFQNERVLPTYEEGIKMGLKPKYNNPAQIITEYSTRLEKLKNNLQFFNELKDHGYIVDAGVASKLPGFAPLSGPGFPRSVVKLADGRTVQGNYYAPIKVAQQINRVFSPEDTGLLGKVFSIGASISRGVQDVTLSGGVPKTPLNAFTFAQAQKEILAGRVRSPISSFVRSISGKSSLEYFQKNAGQIKKMQERNIPITSSFEIKNLIDKDTATKTLGEKLGGAWDAAVNEPTFKRFMPQLQINLFNDVEKQALRGGRSTQEAADIAAKAVRQFYGSTDTATQATRGKLGQNISSTFLFAPKFRESMINFWLNNAKALRHPLALENRANIKFIGGTLLTLGAMNYLNEQLTGHGMLENGPGKEDKLLIPLNDERGTVIGVPFLSSIGTVPRALAREGLSIVKGDIPGAAKDAFQTFSSSTIKPFADVVANQDYFGKPITQETDLPQEKLAKQAKYVGSQFLSHPYIKELANGGNDPLAIRASRAGELPLRFYTQDSINKSGFYDEYYKLKPYGEKLQELAYKDPEAAHQFAQQNSDKLDRLEYLKQAQNAYYDGQDKGKLDSSILANTKNTPQGVSQIGSRVVYKDDEGQWKNVNLSTQPQAPQLTGNSELDKVKIAKYRGEITKKKNDIAKLEELGVITADQAEKQLQDLVKLRGGIGGKKIRVAKVKLSAPKVKRIKVPKAKKVKVKKLTVSKTPTPSLKRFA
jgi:hypothetical protein